MLDKTKFIDYFGTWWPKIEPLFDNGVMNKIFEFLKSESRSGKTIAPISDNTFRCFKETPLENLKVVMMGMCPYHTIVNGKMVADGLLMSCSNHNNYLAPSLVQFYNAVEEEFNNGLCLPCIRTGDLSYLSRQGVLMFNAALTTEINIAKAHQNIWEPFTEHIMKIVNMRDIPVIFLGKEAQKFSFDSYRHFKISHPASVCYRAQKENWSSEGVFKKVNKLLDKPIIWAMEEPPF